MVKAFRILDAILALGLFAPATLIAHAGQAEVRNAAQSPGEKASSPKRDAVAATPDAIKETLRKALKQIQSLADVAAKSENEIRMPSRDMFAMRFEKEMEADVDRAIGRAQAKIGSIEDARATWQNALDATTAISSLDAPHDRAKLYIEIARAQYEAGEQNEARFNVRQAIQSTRAVKPNRMFEIEPPPGMEDNYDPVAKRTVLLRRIAQLQADLGDKAGSDDNFRQAIESAESMKEPLRRISHLLEIAQIRSGDAARSVWTKALDFALSQKDEYPRAKAVEAVIRARLKSLPADETLAIVADRLKGDFQHYMLWVVADAMESSDKPFPPEAVARLTQLALKAQFDRPSKKIKVFERIAEAQARLGDYDGAYRTAGEPHPVNDVQNFRATQARVRVMKAIADAQFKAKQLAAAKDTVQTAIELIAPLPDEDAEAYFPLADLCLLQAKTGDLAGAMRNIAAVSSSQWKVSILSEIAANHAQAGRQAEAKKALALALDASRGAPNDALWTLASGLADRMGDPSLPVLESIAHAQARIGELDAAIKTINGMSQSGFGKFTRGRAIDQVVDTQLEKGDIAGARRAADLIGELDSFMGSKADLLEKIAKQQAKNGDAPGVLAWAADQKVPNSRLRALRGMADGIVQRIDSQNPKPPGGAITPKPAS
jgi:tetratricopeptide (TPR) repeat protein